MNQYVLIFRMDITTKAAQTSPKQMKTYMQDWMKWINEIAEARQLAEGGNHLSPTQSMVLKGNGIKTKGPYVANKESVAGYIIVLAKNLKGAAAIAEKCPILNGQGTSVEVRQTATPGKANKTKRAKQ